MSTSVIVLSHKPGDWLRRCLESVVEQAGEVVLVDNGSQGSAASSIGESFGARVVRSKRNLGYAAGVNLAIHHSTCDVIALLNDDAVAGPTWLSAAGAALEAEDVAAVVPKVLRSGWYREVVFDDEPHDAPADPRLLGRMIRSVTSDGDEVLDRLLGSGIHGLERSPGDDTCWRWTRPKAPFYVPVPAAGTEVLVEGEPAPPGPCCRLLNKAGGYLARDGVLGDVGDESPDDGRWDAPSEPFFGSGTALAFKRETFERVGRLAEPYFAYYEDSDWCWRARLAGMRIVYDPSSTVEHRHSATMGSGTPQAAYLANRNRLLTMVRNAPTIELQAAARRARRAAQTRQELLDIAVKVPWALRSRWAARRGWKLSPGEVWDRWAGAGTEWDRSSCKV